jgi:hypothetical protein
MIKLFWIDLMLDKQLIPKHKLTSPGHSKFTQSSISMCAQVLGKAGYQILMQFRTLKDKQYLILLVKLFVPVGADECWQPIYRCDALLGEKLWLHAPEKEE